MTTKLEIAKRKEERLLNEANRAMERGYEASKGIPLGQPNIIGRGDIYKSAKREWDKGIKLYKEAEKQKDRVQMLEKVDKAKQDNELLKDVHVVGKSKYATVGAKTSVNNLEYFKDKLKKLEQENIENKDKNKKRKKGELKYKTYGAEITKLRNKIKLLENMIKKEEENKQIISDKTRILIEKRLVNQWKKKPIYYFVKDLKKVALEIDENGDFKVSRRYPTKTEKEKEYINNLLK